MAWYDNDPYLKGTSSPKKTWWENDPYLQSVNQAEQTAQNIGATLQGVAAPFQTLANPLVSSLTAPATPVEELSYWGAMLEDQIGRGETMLGGAAQALGEAPEAARERGVAGAFKAYADSPWPSMPGPLGGLGDLAQQLTSDAIVSQLPEAENVSALGQDVASAGMYRSQTARQDMVQKPKDFFSWQSIPYYAQEAAGAVPQLTVMAGLARVNPLFGYLAGPGMASATEYAGERAENRTPAQAQESAEAAATSELIASAPFVSLFSKSGAAKLFDPAKTRGGRVAQGMSYEGLGGSATEALNIVQDLKEGENITLVDAFSRIRDAGITESMAAGPVSAFSPAPTPEPTPEPARPEPGDTPTPTVMETGDKDFDEGQQVAADILKNPEKQVAEEPIPEFPTAAPEALPEQTIPETVATTQEIPPTPTEAPADTLDALAQPEQVKSIEDRLSEIQSGIGDASLFDATKVATSKTPVFTLPDTIERKQLASPQEIAKRQPFHQAVAQATNAHDALMGVRSQLQRKVSDENKRMVAMIDRLVANNDFKQVGFGLVEPEMLGNTNNQIDLYMLSKEKQNTRGTYDPSANAIRVRGLGFGVTGLDPETIIHEASHANSVRNYAAVQLGKVTDPTYVKAAAKLDEAKAEFDKTIAKDLPKLEESDPELAFMLKYASSKPAEFIAVAYSSTKVQDYMQSKTGLIKKVWNALRELAGFSRLDSKLFEKVMKSVGEFVDLKDAGFKPRRKLKFQDTLGQEVDPSSMPLNDMPSDMPAAPKGGAPEKGLIRKASGALLGQGAGLPTEIIQAKELSEGIKRRSDYEATVLANDLRKAMRKAKINTTEQINQVMEYARGVNTPIPDRVKKAVDNFRKRIDIQSVRIAKELGQVEQTNRVAEVRQILLNNVGSYISRAYEADFDKDFGKQSWEAYKQDPTQGRGRIVANAINAVVGDLGKLRTTLEGAAAEAQAKSQGGPQFTPGDMVDRNTLENAYGTYIGKAGAGVSRDQMVAELSQYLAQAQNVQTQAELAVRDMLGLMGSNSKVTNYVRNLRMDDRNLRERQKIRPEFRALWGEMVEPVSNLAITLTRASAVLSGLKSLNRLYSDKPEWFADTPSEKMSVQIPSNPMAYGALAGKYTSDYVYNAIAPASETTQTFIDAISKGDMRSAATAVRNAVGDAASKTTGFMKMMQVVFRPANWIYNSANILLIPMMGGHFNVLGAAKKTLETGTKFAGTNYRTTIDESMARDIERGLIDPSQTRTLSQEATQARREEFYRYKGKYGLHIKEGLKGIGRTVRELYETIEIGPKRYVADKNIEQVMAMFPDMPKEQAIREGIERTQLTTFAYNRVPEIFKLAEKSQLGYFLTYVADTYRIAGNSLVLAAKDAANGIKNGNAKQVQYGIQRLAGTAAATMATTAITQGIVSASAGMVNSLGQLLTGDEEEEWIKRESLPEYLRDKQYLSWQNEDGSFEYFDTSRFDPIDPSANKIRGIIEAIDYFASGDAEKGQEIIGRTVKGVWDDFTGLSPLARAITGKAPKAGIRYSTPNTYRELQEYVINTLGIDEATADLALGAVNQFTSGATSGIAKAMESGDESAIRQAMRTANFEMFKVDALEQIADREGQFFKNGQNEAYDQVRYLVRMQRNPSGLEDAYREAIENEREAFNKLSTKVKLAKIQGKEDSEIRQSLIQGGVPRTQVYKILNDEFEPKQIDFEPTIKAELEGTKSYEEKSKRRREMQERVNRLNEIRNSYKETK